MDLLQIALIFLMLLLAVFLTITGVQVFFILRDLQQALERLNRVLDTGEEIAEDIETYETFIRAWLNIPQFQSYLFLFYTSIVICLTLVVAC